MHACMYVYVYVKESGKLIFLFLN